MSRNHAALRFNLLDRNGVKTRLENLLILLFSVLLVSSLLFAPTNSFQTGDTPKIFNLGLIIHDLNATERQWCMNWISQFDPFAKWNFILRWPYRNLDDEVFLNFLKARGELICADGYMQLIPQSERESEMDFIVNTFNAHNVTLKGLFMFQPDTYTLNYVRSNHNFEYYVGYCFEQYTVDYMTMKGGWQLPYYHNPEHALKPAEGNEGLVVFPHVTWDWVSSLTHSHCLNTHIFDVYQWVYHNSSQAVDYCLRLINESLSCSEPFGYACAMFEWEWVLNGQDFNETGTDYYQQIINQYGSICQFYGETTAWFKANCLRTPTYRVTFTSPYDAQQVEWYLDVNYRIARLENCVKSYVIFENQTECWLNQTSTVDFSQPSNETNCVDNSLKFEIDDLGGGFLRDSAKGGSEYYTGTLTDFPVFHVRCMLTVSTLRNNGTTFSDITLSDENLSEIEVVKNASSHQWLLHGGIYYVQASIFYKSHTYTCENVCVNLTKDTQVSMNFFFANLSISCVDIENHPLPNCTLIFRRQDEEYTGATDEFGLQTLEAYFGNWTVVAYWMGVLVGEANISVDQSMTNSTLQCNVGDLAISAFDQNGGAVEASVFLTNYEYSLTFSGIIQKSKENITFAQVPLINYSLIVEDNYETQTRVVDTSQTRYVQATLTHRREVVELGLFEIAIIVGTVLALIAVPAIIKKRHR
jgi:hypothetical protein